MSSTSTDPIPVIQHSTARRRLLVVFSTVLSLLIPCGVAWQLRGRINSGSSDFSAFYAAGEIVRSGNGARLYDPTVQLNAERAIPRVGLENELLAYAHAPFEALPFAVLARLCYKQAVWMYWLINLALPYVCLWFVLPHLPYVASRSDLAVLAIGVFYPFFVAECQGQDSLFTLMFCTLSFICSMRGRYWAAGSFLGLAMCKPPLAIPVLLLLVVSSKKHSPVLAGFLTSCVALLMVSLATVGWTGIVAYPRFLSWFAASANEQLPATASPNLRGLFFSVLGSHVSYSVLVRVVQISSILLLIFLVWLLLRTKIQVRDIPLVFSIAITATVLVAFHEYGHDLSLMFLPVILVWNYAAQYRADGGNSRLLMALVPVMLCVPCLTVQYPQIYTCCILFFLAVLCRQIYKTSVARPAEQVNAIV
ncbi:MAG TPA: glycosyltransferase family 87 protein [Terracidiphilus sp.]|jgi:hypothetical protein